MTRLTATPPIDADRLLTVLIELAKEAGDLVLKGFGGRCAHETKVDASPVTEYDQAAEVLIARRLGAAFPAIPLVAEEAISQGHVPPDLGNRFFLVDPLDGTREFVAGNPDFTVNIALIADGIPVCGVVLAPAHGELFVGSAEGAFRSRHSPSAGWTPLDRIEARARPPRAVALVSRSHRTPATDRYLETIPLAQVVPMGSSLKYCRIAEGAADLCPCLGRTMEWDIAAAHAVLRAAGGAIHTMDGAPIRYGKRGRSFEADFANAPFVATGRAAAAPS